MKKYKGFCKNISTKINHYFTFFRTVRLFSSIFHANIRFFMWFSNRIRISEHLLLFPVRHSVYPLKMHISHTGPTTLSGMFQFPAITISSFSRPIFVHIFSYFQKQLFYFSVCQKNKKRHPVSAASVRIQPTEGGTYRVYNCSFSLPASSARALSSSVSVTAGSARPPV